jgi:serine/threonine protein kinase
LDNLQSGQMLGPYRIISELGRGGMSIVYKAYHPTMDRYVGIKVLIHQYANDEGFRGRFRQEVRLLSKLEHPHILAVYDCGETPDETPEGIPENVPYLVMRYLDGGTLKEYMGTQMPPAMREGQASGAVTTRVPGLPLEVTDQFFTQLADALQYAHEQGIIHRDIKPGNVMVDRRGNVFLTDFGIAKLMEGSTHFTPSGAITGTPAYMSPEQAEGEKLDPRSDIYSLGVVLYEMLTGRVPYEAETPVTALQKKLTEPLPSPKEINAEISPLMEAVLYRALAKSRDDRFSSMREFLVAWKQAVSTKPGYGPVSATPPSKQLGVWSTAEAKAPPPSPPPSPPQRMPTPQPYARSASASTRVTPPPVQQDKTQLYQERKSKIPIWGWLVGIAIFLCIVVVGVSGLLVVNNLFGPKIQTSKTATVEVQPSGTAITLLQAATVTPPQATTQPLTTLQAIITPLQTLEPITITGNPPPETTALGNSQGEGEMLVYGPKKGGWEHHADAEPQLLSTDLNESNFTAQVSFYNPYPTAIGIWDAGFIFRSIGTNNGLGLIIRADKTWELGDYSEGKFTVVEKGKVDSLDDRAGKSNKVVLMVLDEIGFLFVNNFFCGSIDISRNTSAGNVLVGTGFYKERSGVEGKETQYEDLNIWKMPVAFGPVEGALEHTNDGKLKTSMAGINLKNFIAKANFSVPYISSQGLWNVGFVFRSQAENDQMRVFAQSDSLWMFGNKSSHLTDTTWLSHGKPGYLNLAPEDSNELILVVLGDRSIFLVNRQLVTKPDLAARMDSGDVGVGTGFLKNDQITGKNSGYTDFTIWRLP